MPPILRYAALFAVVFAAVSATPASAQSLRYVPSIYNVSLPSPTLLHGPTALAADIHGNAYIVDTGHSRVWKVDTFGITSLFAGQGTGTYSGDNGLAVKASLNAPDAVAVDVAGNVFIADTGNYAIRRVDAVTGVITTVAGGNGAGNSGNNGPATAAKFQQPSGIVVDSAGTLYVSDATSAVVRRIDTSGTITLFAGAGAPATGNGDGGLASNAKLINPYGLALDITGSLYIADVGASVVRVVSPANIIATFAGSTYGNAGMGGLATSAKLKAPRAVAADSSGNIYIADGVSNLVTVVDTTKTINVLAGSAIFGGVGDGLPASIVQILAPNGVAVDSLGNVFIDSNTNAALYKVVQHPEQFPFTKVGQSSAQQRLIVQNMGTTTINISSVVASGDFSVSTAIVNPNYRPCATTYNTLAATAGNNFCTIDVIFSPTATGVRSFPLTVTSTGTPTTTVATLTSSGMSPTAAVSGGILFTVAGMVPEDLTVRNDNVLATTVSLGELDGLAFDSTGDLYISEYSFCDVRRVDAQTGIISTIAGSVAGVCGSASGDGGPATLAVFNGVGQLAVGPDKTLYVVDGLNHEIRSIDTSGVIHRYAGNGTGACNVASDGSIASSVPICAATGIAVDTAGNLYFSEPGVEAIRKVNPAGILSTVAGTFGAAPGDLGDGGPALSAQLNNPWSIVVDAHGNIFFADAFNHIIRRIDATTNIITTVAGTPSIAGYAGDGGPATLATLNIPYGLAIDAVDNLYIGDSQNNVVRKVDTTTGIITTVAGNNALGSAYNGNGLAATASGVDYPGNLAVDPAGYILLSDLNQLVRKVSPNGVVDFGNQKVGAASNAQSVTISNIGYLPLHFDFTTPYTIDGDFSVASGGTCNFSQPLAVGANCTVQVVFAPTALYERYGTLNLNDDGIGSPPVTELRGNGTAAALPLATLAPASIAFANQIVNTTGAVQAITVSNPGGATLHISGVSIAGANPSNFSQTNNCGASLGVGATCTISVTFTPTAVAPFAARIVLADDAANSPQTAALNGAGISVPATPDFGITAAPASASVAAGNTATYTITLASLSSSNPFNGVVTLSVAGLPAGATAMFAPTAVTPGATSANTTLSIVAPQSIASLNESRPDPHRALGVVSLATLLFGFVGMGKGRPAFRRLLTVSFVLATGGLVAGGLTGCGSGGYALPPPSSTATPPSLSTYTITVTGTSGSTHHSTTVSLTVN
jgi:sugar lactone lactonase YvrE